MMARLDDQELQELNEKVAMTNMSREEYLRMIIKGYQPVAKPDIEYKEVLKQLHYIGNNIRQIAVKAYYTKNVNFEFFKETSEKLDEVVSGLTSEMARRTVKD